ncbi:molybdate ABC transporter substrate-binding protein [Paenibacillus arenilitoris]|uniref:Molybdate ABC transporter substrate-binding protein n=1 Tax=Paenibacillus arenilitoris TaxID=2772299 RepID=A0A927H6N3_9BACL|nr:molybdate ABC transporter substrate-binding protein [Paenibacillus arenilitoris]MBD2868744.1 molybdate ABC transporter substrate-binding protein [Paenibacillus arenilitoris]
MFKFVKNNAILICVLIALLAVAGCGGGAEPKANTSAGANAGAGAQASAPSEQPAEHVELTVSAAASMTDALEEIKTAYEAANPNVGLTFNFGASGALQQQIEEGAPADLFLSAAVKNMKALVDGGFIDAEGQKTLLANELVAVVSASGNAAVAGMEDLTNEEVKKVAIGIPESVPAGSYAKEALEGAALWETLRPKLVQAKDVRQVLQYVETGNVDVGFVYKTDAMTSDKVKVAYPVDPAAYTPIEYPAGIVKATKHPEEAERFYAYLQTEPAHDVFVKYGFTPAVD